MPDAYFIDADARLLYVFEVSVTSRMPPKFSRYTDMFWLLDYFVWEIVIIDVDEHGTGREVCKLPEVAVNRGDHPWSEPIFTLALEAGGTW
jgi:hypothetical protein